MNYEDAAKLAIEKGGNKAIELIQKRIQSQGKDSNDSPFSPYSTDYAQVRRRNSKKTNYKDFTFSGGMFASFKVLKTEFMNNIASVTIGMSTEKYEKIVGKHSGSEGNLIIAPSQNEINEVAKLFTIEFLRNLT